MPAERVAASSSTVGRVAELTEKQLQTNIVSLATMLGFKVYHTFDSRHSQKGFPDCTFLRDGVLAFIELKRDARYCKSSAKTGLVSGVTTEQQTWLDELAKVPGVRFAGVIRPADWFAGKVEVILGAMRDDQRELAERIHEAAGVT